MRTPPLPSDKSSRLAKPEAPGIISPAEDRFDRITSVARTVFGVPVALISLMAERCQWFKSAQGATAAATPREIAFSGQAILQEDTFVVSDASKHPEFAGHPLVTGKPGIRFYAGHPVKFEGSLLGTLCIIDRVARQLSPSERNTLRSLAGWVESELTVTALSEAQGRLLKELNEAKRTALIDPLTKTWNRRGMDVVMHGEMDRARSSQQRVGLMVLEVDQSKDINAQYGNQVRDLMLKKIAQRIRSSVRPSNVIVRYGDHKFLLFVGDCREKTGKILSERIVARVRNEPIRLGKAKIDVSLTIGVASAYAAGKMDTEELSEMADGALREARAAGGNCIRFKAKNWKPGGG